jgi:hypothetical protein
LNLSSLLIYEYKRLPFAILSLCMVKVMVDSSYEQKNRMATIKDSGKSLRLLGSWILSIVRYPKEHKRTQRFGNWICFRPQATGWQTLTLLGPLERDNLSHSSILN